MKYFIVLLAVGVVFAQQPFDTSFEDNQQEIETQNVEDDDTRRPAVIPSTTDFLNVNVQALTALINDLIDINMASEPAVQFLHLSMRYHNAHNSLMIRSINTTTFQLSRDPLDELVFENERTSATSTILAYRPSYNFDFHQSSLGAIFLNLDRLFPCIVHSKIIPACRRFTQEEDGFFKGKTITEAGDVGNHLEIFGSSVKTYGFVFESCPYLNGINGCFPHSFQTVITCFLPRSCL